MSETRKRGRPPKTKEPAPEGSNQKTSAEDDEEHPAKRSRGRPKKVETGDEKTSDTTKGGNSNIDSPTRTGPPASTPVKTSATADAPSSASKEKRGRGRPRKNPTEPLKPKPVSDGPKRGRGRPKKDGSSSIVATKVTESTSNAQNGSNASKSSGNGSKGKAGEKEDEDDEADEMEGGEAETELKSNAKKDGVVHLVLPEDFQPIPVDTNSQFKIVTYNVASLASAIKRGAIPFFEKENADIYLLQEVRTDDEKWKSLLSSLPSYPHVYFNPGKVGHHGVCVLSRVQPKNVTYTLPSSSDDVDKLDPVERGRGRLITLEFSDFFLVHSYVPHAGVGLKNLESRKAWDSCMESYLKTLKASKPVMWAGDLNVAHSPVDLARPKQNNFTAGFTKEERDGFSKILELGLVDVYRHFNPDKVGAGSYTYYSYKFSCRQKGLGWRIDYFVASKELLSRIVRIDVRDDAYGASDHLPLILVMKK